MRLRDYAKQIAICGAIAVLLPYCGGESVDSGSSESHFLTPCNDTCEAGLTCICGVCTKPCDGDTSCAALAPGATCVSACDSSTDQPTTTCELTCSATADCAALGADYSCVDGKCRTCFASATQKVRDFVQSEKSCTTSAECVAAASWCYAEEACSSVAMHAGYDEQLFSTLLDELAQCAPQGCIACTADPGSPICIDGRCQFSHGGSELSCDERTAQASAWLQQAVDAADKSCTTAADCTIIGRDTDCSHSCSDIVSVTGAASVQATIDEINNALCSTFASDGCLALVPPCPYPGQPDCVAGQCSVSLGQ